MIKIKHLMEKAEPDDGQRIWVESVNLTKDLCEWCSVHHLMSQLGPPGGLSEWFEEHQDGYEYFRARYHECLQRSPYRAALQRLACVGRSQTFTLLHSGDDPQHNTATALYEFLSELEAYCPPESETET